MTENEKIEYQVESRYQIIKKLGSGAYGHVWKVKQKQSKNIYALKKIFEAFQHSTDAQRTFRQISILKKIEHKNVIKLYQVFLGKNNRDVYLVFQFMQTDLYHALYEDLLQSIHKKYVVYQMLLSIYYIHSAGIIHRDLKPSNILLNAACQAKVCDFGLARCLNSKFQQSQVLTQGVATRWYRAPEVLLGSNVYNQKADIWSIGCIISQILLKNPIFPGSSTINQLERIIQFTGRPDSQDIESIKCQYAQNFINQCQQIKTRSRKQFFGSECQTKCVDLIYKILKFNPQKRFSIKQILTHQYFEELYSEKDLVDSKRIIELQVSDNMKLATQEYQKLIQKFQTIKKEKQYLINRPSSAYSYKDYILNKSPLKNQNRSPKNIKQAQKFGDIVKIRQQSFGKLLSQSKIKLRSESNDLKQTNKKLHLFSQIIKNKDSARKRAPSQQSKQKNGKDSSFKNGKENIHSNISNQIIKSNIDLKIFQNTTRSRISFQGLKKNAKVKFAK